MRARLTPLLVLGALGITGVSCKQETVIQQQENVAPVVSINTPDDGDTFTEGSAIEFSGTVADDNGLADIQSVVWTSSEDGELGDPEQVTPDANGTSRLAATLSVGLHTITLRVTDADGAQAEDSIGLTVEAMEQLPSAEIIVPSAFQEYDLGADVDLSGIVGDPNQAADTLTTTWTINHTTTGDVFGPYVGPAGTGGTTTAQVPNAPEGNFLATLGVEDDDGNTAEAQVYFLVVDPRDRDDDNDGWTPNQGDCNDADGDAYPGNAEICDGIDNDCDGQIDNKDDDADNHIDQDCTLYSGTLPVDDCDDSNSAVHPLAPEISDGLDNDCNGTPDDSTPTYDNDGDCFCIGPDACTGSVNASCVTLETGDCNDNDATIDPVDDDGDGASECAGDCDDDDATLSAADLDNDGFSTCAGDCNDDDAALTPVDVDQDGFSTCDGDCDDRTNGCGADCFPGNTDLDVCNGDDEDCDASVDEDPERVYYPDADGDGFIDPTGFVYACADPDGPATNWTSGTTAADCDDDPNACGADCFPNNSAEDVCDTYNQDCDSAVDEDADVIWYHDADLDGYTDSADTQLACDDPDGTGGEWLDAATTEEDCDDDPSQCGADCFPGNTDPDVCDTYNQDCDASVDEDAEIPWYADADGDSFTNSSDITYACADPGTGWESTPSAQEDCDDDPNECGADCFPGNTGPDVCDTYNQDCDASTDEDPDTVWYADLDGDTWTDNGNTATQCDAPDTNWTTTASGQTDCDDDPNACGADCFPTNSAADICDGDNQDCDASTDEDPEIDWYIDADGDGATLGTPVYACSAPGADYEPDASASLDCDDDTNACGADCFPGNTAEDVCDGNNQDCDTFTDEDVDITWYQDADGDGFTGSNTQTACTDIDGSGTEWLAAPTAQADCDDNPFDCGNDCFPGNTDPDICDGDNQDCDASVDEDPQTPYYHDADGDGYTANSDIQFACSDPDSTGTEWLINPSVNDCDDGTTASDCGADCYPNNGSPDICDGFDQDCSGVADEDPDITWYGDADGDGYTGTGTQLACDDPDGTGINWVDTATETDCLDTGVNGPNAYPNNTAPDVCDGINQDCDASTDENPEIDWFEDADGDGYTGTNVTYACNDPDGASGTWQATAEGDCDDDTNACGAACNPGITVDGCDSYNNDCDTQTDENPDITWYEDADGDNWTNNSSTQLSCSDPGADWDPAATTNDCNDGSAALNHDDDDNDGQTTCAGDCDDGSAFLNTLDEDNDGYDTCSEGDCNDDPNASGANYNPGEIDYPDASYEDLNCDGIDGDYSVAILVRTGGSNVSGCGDLGNECATPDYGISQAASQGRDEVYVQAGSYSGVVTVFSGQSGVDVYGGFDTNWVRDDYDQTGHESRITGGTYSSQYMTVYASATTVSFDNFVFDAPNASGRVSGNGKSSYGLYATNSNLYVSNSEVQQGNGVTGLGGANGTSASSTRADDGDNGIDAASYSSSCSTGRYAGGAGGTGGCAGTNGGDGGSGGAMDTSCGWTGFCSNCDATDGAAGAAAETNPSGTVSDGGYRTTGCNQNAGNGYDGRVSDGGPGARGLGGGLSGSWWYGDDGENGTLGLDGTGGGGGGGSAGCDDGTDDRGASGGGGGSGGCRASDFGDGGGGGGGSFGVFGVSSLLDVRSTVFVRGSGGGGGAGGDGGTGQPGGLGGDGGNASTDSGSGGNGGNGGRGGHSGSGGGGAGGHSYGIYRTGGSTAASGNSYTGGSAGSGGAGGTGGIGASNGANGTLGGSSSF